MAAFRRVEAKQAGSDALGILVPQGARTLVILRPRALQWDLLPAKWCGDPAVPPAFCSFTRDEAAQAARRVQQSLADAVERGINPVETLSDAAGQRHQVWLRLPEFVWIVCSRSTGQAYVPLLFASAAEAVVAAESLVPFIWPGPNAEQAIYFNTMAFG